VLDPFCGAATVLIERAHLGRYRNLIGSDRDARALDAARENVGPRYKPIELHNWDAAALPLREHSVSKIVTNLPWGVRTGSHADNRRLYPRWLDEMKRVLRPGGIMVLLAAETQLMRTLWNRRAISPERVMRVTVLGRPAAVYLCRS
jgi:tRNA G10  N-methylase Trm11